MSHKVGELTREEIQDILGKELAEFKGNTEQENLAVVLYKYPDIKLPMMRAYPETNYQVLEIWDES